MNITIITHPNPNMDILDSVIETIKSNALINIDIKVSWKKVNNIESIEGLKVYALSDPFYTIDSCMHDYDLKATNRSYRWNMIKQLYGYDLSIYSETEAASLSYLLWVEIAKQNNIDCVFKIENPDGLYTFLKDKNVLDKHLKIYNNSNLKFKPKNIGKYTEMSYGTINLLSKYCKFYNYTNYIK